LKIISRVITSALIIGFQMRKMFKELYPTKIPT